MQVHNVSHEQSGLRGKVDREGGRERKEKVSNGESLHLHFVVTVMLRSTC